MGILFLNLLSKSIFDFGKWSNGKYQNAISSVLQGVFGLVDKAFGIFFFYIKIY